MKYIIRDDQRGLLQRNGKLEKWLEPGPHRFWPYFNDIQVDILDLKKPVAIYRPELEAIAPRGAWKLLEVASEELAVVYVNELPTVLLRPGRFMLWQVRDKVRAEVFSLKTLEPEIPECLWHLMPNDLTEIVHVSPFERVLAYEDGRLAKVLDTGPWLLSSLHRTLRTVTVDMREHEKTILGQELMTADKVSLRLNCMVKYRIVDVVKSVEEVISLDDALYSETQLAVRRRVSGIKLDELLESRQAQGESMLSEVGARARDWGVEVISVDVKDVVLPGEMKALLNRVIEAEKQAAAHVILRREETAATRSQANTAKVLEANPVLLRLKEMEMFKEIASSLDQVTLVAGADGFMNRLVSQVGLKNSE
ncbi:MAG: slipin family protein [Myxococcales bacterium]|nr:slipin family protein [Myxococcales bacterium]